MKKIALLSALLYFISTTVFAQQDSTDEKDLDEAVVYSNKFVEKKKILFRRSISSVPKQLPGLTAKTPVICWSTPVMYLFKKASREAAAPSFGDLRRAGY